MRELWIINTDIKFSHKNRESYYHLELFDEGNIRLLNTYISKHNKNWRWWRDVISHSVNHPHDAILITGDFQLKTPDVVNADTRPELAAIHDREDLLQAVYELYLA